MYNICKTYHGRLVAEGLLKAEVSCMGDKPLQVGVGKQVLGKILKHLKRTKRSWERFKKILKGQAGPGKRFVWSLLAPVGEGSSWEAHWQACLAKKQNLRHSGGLSLMKIPGRLSVSHLKRTFSLSRPKASRSAASLSWGTWATRFEMGETDKTKINVSI